MRFFLYCLIGAALWACNTSEPPTVLTLEVLNVQPTSFRVLSELVDNGNENVIACGVVYGNKPRPTLENAYTTGSACEGLFFSSVNNVVESRPYYVRAYATNAVGTGYGKDILVTTPGSIGDTMGGGIIAYILQPEDSGYVAGQTKGLIAAPEDFPIPLPWSCDGLDLKGTATYMASGSANTSLIMAACADSGSAAHYCGLWDYNGYSDWHLPSREEMNALMLNQLLIGGFKTAPYWTSSQGTASSAWTVDFVQGFSYGRLKTDSLWVRPIRSF